MSAPAVHGGIAPGGFPALVADAAGGAPPSMQLLAIAEASAS
jgi:hypothetical protein